MKSIKIPVLFIALAFACSPKVKIEKSWRDPEVTVDVQKLNKVLLVALLDNEANRRSTEDQLAGMLGGKGVPSYQNYLTKDIRQESESTVRSRIENENFDGVIIMRLVDVEKDQRWVPGQYPPFYGRFWGYYWNYYNNFYNQGHYETTKKFTIETNVYSLKRDKLIWSGITSSVDPANVGKLMNATAGRVFKEMKKEGFVTGI